MTTAATIAIACDHRDLLASATALAARWQLPLADCHTDSYDFLLVLQRWDTEPGYLLKLQQTGTAAAGPVFVDFTSGKSAHRRHYGGGRGQTLARAIGLRGGFNPDVLDVCAGLGRDAFVLAALGCQLTLIERHPVIYELLHNGIVRALQHSDTRPIAMRMQLIYADSIDYLRKLPANTSHDVIYLDPMYPARSKSALVKKEMRYFHAIAGADEDAGALLRQALRCHVRRIVVKRPVSAAALDDTRVDTVIRSKNTRYDVYLNPSHNSSSKQENM